MEVSGRRCRLVQSSTVGRWSSCYVGLPYCAPYPTQRSWNVKSSRPFRLPSQPRMLLTGKLTGKRGGKLLIFLNRAVDLLAEAE